MLAALGVGPVAKAPTRPVMAGVLLRRQVEHTACTTGQVAELLDRDPSRIRQRLDGPRRSLLGFHRQSGQREWLLPGFQFELGIHDQPGWAAPLQALPQADATSPTAPARTRQVGPVTGALGHPPPADAVDPRGMHP